MITHACMNLCKWVIPAAITIGMILGIIFLVELEALEGRKKLGGVPVYSLIKF